MLDTDEDYVLLYSTELEKAVRLAEISSRGSGEVFEIERLWLIYRQAFTEATQSTLRFWELLAAPFADLDLDGSLWVAVNAQIRGDLETEIDPPRRSERDPTLERARRRWGRAYPHHSGSTATGLRPFFNTLYFINAAHDAGLVVEDRGDHCPGALSDAYPERLPSDLGGWGLTWGFLDRLVNWFAKYPDLEHEYDDQACLVILTVNHLAATIEELVDEADALIRQRMERGGGRLTGPSLSADRLAAIMEIEDWQKIRAVGLQA